MTAIAFVGPTLHGSHLPWPPHVERRPPAMLGDIAAAARRRPSAIALIDGCFGFAPSVWHREILEAMELGIPVSGGGSLGAIRAAELHSFGMVGVGHVFEAYRSGAITRDDAVLVLQGPPELGSAPVTIALVDAEATIRQAPIPPYLRTDLLQAARRTVYFERTWEFVVNRLCVQDAHALIDTLRASTISIKRLDAEMLIGRLVGGLQPVTPRHAAFAATSHYRRMLARAGLASDALS